MDEEHSARLDTQIEQLAGKGLSGDHVMGVESGSDRERSV
jgi:hypothetical protein